MLKRSVRRHGEGGTQESHQDLRCAHAGSIPKWTHGLRTWEEVRPPAKTPEVKKSGEARGKRQVLTRRQRWGKSKAPSLRWVRKSVMFHSTFSFKAVLGSPVFPLLEFFCLPKVSLPTWHPATTVDAAAGRRWRGGRYLGAENHPYLDSLPTWVNPLKVLDGGISAQESSFLHHLPGACF